MIRPLSAPIAVLGPWPSVIDFGMLPPGLTEKAYVISDQVIWPLASLTALTSQTTIVTVPIVNPLRSFGLEKCFVMNYSLPFEVMSSMYSASASIVLTDLIQKKTLLSSGKGSLVSYLTTSKPST